MAGEIAWLDGYPVWHGDRVAWQQAHDVTVPTGPRFALAQRRLNQIARHSTVSAHVFGDAAGWIAWRTNRLHLAKQLSVLHVPELPDVAARARTHDGAAIRTLASMLMAEAFCVLGLPVLPSSALATCGEHAEEAVRRVMQDQTWPRESRALAALVLGTIHAQAGVRADASVPDTSQARELRRAYRWGAEHGLPHHPAIMTRLLLDERGVALARRYARTLAAAHPFQLSSSTGQQLLVHGERPARVVSLAEAMATAEPLASLVTRAPDEARPRARKTAWDLKMARREKRLDAVSDLASLLDAYARASADPAVIAAAIRIAHVILDLGPVTDAALGATAIVLRKGLALPGALQCGYLDILLAYQDRIWPRESDAGAAGGKALQQWFEGRLQHIINPLVDVLIKTRNPRLVRDAVDLDALFIFRSYDWVDTGRYLYALELMRVYRDTAAHSICWFLDNVPSAARARATLHPLTRALSGIDRPARDRVLEAVLDDVTGQRQQMRQRIRRVVPYVKDLATFVQAQDAGNEHWLPVEFVLMLDETVGADARGWATWLLSHLATRPAAARTWHRIHQAVSLALSLTRTSLSTFQSVVRTALRHEFDYDWGVADRGIEHLAHSPDLHDPVVHLFPQLPHRCMRLIVRLGLAGRLPDGKAPHLVPRPVRAEDMPGDWTPILDLAPDLARLARAYVAAQKAMGGDPGVPAGIRRAAGQEQRWVRELRHIEDLASRHPDRRDLTVRIANLHTRLADRDRMQADLHDDIAERLQQAAAEAQLAAAEHVVQSLYRSHLEKIAGPIPAELAIDDDLINAVLLATDVRWNRRLLRRLLRAYVAGDRRWPERHPANVAFLDKLAAGGVEVTTWLSSHPRVYRHASVPGGHLHVYLERDPLRVLQMGNLFDTCLSFGGVNAFSTIANACELNKRVVYARDGLGRIVGRKLIGVTGEGTLIGFRTYTGLHDEDANAAVRAIMRHYCVRFAAACHLPLADQGTVPTLFASHWYDDGAVPWQGEDDAATTGIKSTATMR
jgi:hypothetical protein